MIDGRQTIRTRRLLYQDDVGHDACGIGGIASRHGAPSHEVVKKALLALKNLEHRGGICGESGDGAGFCCQLPQEFFREEARRLNFDRYLRSDAHLAVGVFFFLDRAPELQEKAKEIIQDVLGQGLVRILGWRSVPARDDLLSAYARQTKPVIEQLLLLTPPLSPPSEGGIEGGSPPLNVGSTAPAYNCGIALRKRAWKSMFHPYRRCSSITKDC